MAVRLITDPVDAKLDEFGDFVIERGDFVLTRGLEAVAQAVAIRLRRVRGERILDLDEGIPLLSGSGVAYEDALLEQPFDEDKWRAAYREEALKVDDVLAVKQLDVAHDGVTREVEVSMTLSTEFGDTQVTVGG